MKRMSGSSVNVLDVLLAVYSFYLAFLEENTSTKSKTLPNIIQIYLQIKKYAKENSHQIVLDSLKIFVKSFKEMKTEVKPLKSEMTI